MTPEIGGPYRWERPGDAPPRVERLTIDEVESGSVIPRLMRWQREFMLEVMEREFVIDRITVTRAATLRRPAPDPPRTVPWGVVPCGRPRPGMGVAVPNTGRVTMRNVTPRLERRR